MYKELNGKMELHVSHELSMRKNVDREYLVKDYTVIVQKPIHGVHHA